MDHLALTCKLPERQMSQSSTDDVVVELGAVENLANLIFSTADFLMVENLLGLKRFTILLRV
jgi:hypothetical protein